MVRRSANDPLPREFAVAGTGEWPYCRVSGPRFAHAAAKFARGLDRRKGGLSVREVARQADVDPNVIARVLRGESWANGLQFFKISTRLGLDVFGPSDLARYDHEQLIEDFAAFIDQPIVTDRFGAAWPAAGEIGHRRLRADIYLPELGMIIEAKSTLGGRRLADIGVRGAISHFDLLRRTAAAEGLTLALLLDQPPDPEAMIDLKSHHVDVIYPQDGGFTDSLGGLLVQMICEGRGPSAGD